MCSAVSICILPMPLRRQTSGFFHGPLIGPFHREPHLSIKPFLELFRTWGQVHESKRDITIDLQIRVFQDTAVIRWWYPSSGCFLPFGYGKAASRAGVFGARIKSSCKRSRSPPPWGVTDRVVLSLSVPSLLTAQQ